MNKLLLATIALLALGGTAMAAGPYDGVYNGTRTTKALRPGALGCTPMTADASITVTDNRFGVTVGNFSKDIEVSADGTIKGSMQYRTSTGIFVVNFAGKITNGDFQMDRGNEYCATHVSLKKS